MKRLILGFTVTIAMVVFPAASAQASGLTIKEAKQAVFEKSMELGGYRLPQSGNVTNCSKLASDRVRCSGSMTIETYWKLRKCSGRFEVTGSDVLKVRILRRSCHNLDVPFLSFERARQVALRKMDPHAGRFSTGYGGSTDGRNRYEIEAEWSYGGQVCLQTARVRLADGKVLVNVSEPNCVDIPDWPKRKG